MTPRGSRLPTPFPGGRRCRRNKTRVLYGTTAKRTQDELSGSSSQPFEAWVPCSPKRLNKQETTLVDVR